MASCQHTSLLQIAGSSLSLCNTQRSTNLPQELPEPDKQYPSSIFLFADVVCIFADDMGGLERTTGFILRCAALSSASSAPRQVRPRVIIVCSSQEASATFQILEIEESRYKLLQDTGHGIYETFSEISVMYLPGDHCSLRAKYRILYDKLIHILCQMRQVRYSSSLLFNAKHLACFMEQAIQHTSVTLTQEFNFTQESRKSNPVNKDFGDHIRRFLCLCAKFKVPYEAVSLLIGSAILLDAYPVGMHCQYYTRSYIQLTSLVFSPTQVFKTLCNSLCADALRDVLVDQPEFSSWYCNRIEEYFTSFYSRLESLSAIEIHVENLEKHQDWWSEIRTNRTCLSCLSVQPEYVSPCKHAFCEDCVRRFGKEIPECENLYQFQLCVLCASGSWTVKLKPVTAGISLLNIDGGGTRAIVPLEFLEMIQSNFGKACLIQDLFDSTIGTSSGRLSEYQKRILTHKL
jgi:hypothetical protein